MLPLLGNATRSHMTSSLRVRLITRSITLTSHSRPTYVSQLPLLRNSYATETVTITETTTVKKPRTRKTTSASAKPVKKSATKATKKATKKPKAKKIIKKPAKKPVKKPARAPSARTIQKQRVAAVTALKKQALISEEPGTSTGRRGAYTQFLSERYATARQDNSADKIVPAEVFTDFVREYRSLSSSEKEALTQRAEQIKAQAAEAHKAWIQSHTPYEIHLANQARTTLRSQLKTNYDTTKKGSRYKDAYRKLEDPRLPVRPQSASLVFFKERWASGDLDGVPVPEGGARLSKEWHALSDGEKEKYYEAAKESQKKYKQECESVFGPQNVE